MSYETFELVSVLAVMLIGGAVVCMIGVIVERLFK